MIIETQNTPDKNVLNFFPPQRLLPQNQAQFIDSKSLRQSPLAENIFPHMCQAPLNRLRSIGRIC